MDSGIFDKRVQKLNVRSIDESGDCVIYWMQRSQRAFDNPALTYAIDMANDRCKPLLAYFGLYDAYPMASARAFAFMIEGLGETARALDERGIGFLVRREMPADGAVRAAKEFRACAVVVDEDYLNIGRFWRSRAAENLDVGLFQVDAETIVPARMSDHREWGAYTLRPKILKVLEQCLVDAPEHEVRHRWSTPLSASIDIDRADPLALSSLLQTDQNVAPTPHFAGGLSKAQERLRCFIEVGLPKYGSERNDIGVSVSSDMSPYLHFGQIASLRVALAVRDSDAADDCVDAFLEQLIVRRELAINFCLYNPQYAEMDGAVDWAARTLAAHAHDQRPEIYTLEELESASTHDDLWNAAQTELVRFGRIHPYMRMVWAKNILTWSPTPGDALARAIFLNDKYAIDGRDPNGYTNIAWCILGTHDRPFAERPVFGKIRSMTTDATKRKTHWREYIQRVSALRQ